MSVFEPNAIYGLSIFCNFYKHSVEKKSSDNNLMLSVWLKSILTALDIFGVGVGVWIFFSCFIINVFFVYFFGNLYFVLCLVTAYYKYVVNKKYGFWTRDILCAVFITWIITEHWFKFQISIVPSLWSTLCVNHVLLLHIHVTCMCWMKNYSFLNQGNFMCNLYNLKKNPEHFFKFKLVLYPYCDPCCV